MKRLLVIALVAGGLSLGLGVRGLSQTLAPAQQTQVRAAMDDVQLVPHRSVYDFRMLGISSGQGLSDIRGSMYYEQGDACDAWTTDHRFTSEYYYPERAPLRNVSQYVAWEAKDKSVFQFNSERQETGNEAQLLRGSVELRDDGTATAVFSRPGDLTFDLPEGYYLPSQHTVEIIRRARAGEKFFNAVLFDGTDADGPVEVNAFIGRAVTDEERASYAKDQPKIDATLLQAPGWHVRMAVFPLLPREGGGGGGDGSMPSYEMDMVLHDNGVVSRATVDYQQFKVRQSLMALETLPDQGCKP